jgi:glycosyltransferase involved in cell wall biosynthesis
MRRRLVLITEIIAPYRIPVFNALAARPEVDLHVIFLSETDPSLRQWHVHTNEIRFSYEVLPSLRKRIGKYNVLLNRSVTRALDRARPEVVVCGGYNYVASWQAARWAKRHAIPFLLWTESTGADQRRQHFLVEKLKRSFFSLCTAFVVPGTSSRQYLHKFNIPDSTIFTAPNAMDLGLFAETANAARVNSGAARRDCSLPERYFLNVGRLVALKGVLELLDAYSQLDPTIRIDVGLVFAGDGLLKDELARRASKINPGTVRFTGFLQKDRLPEIYALADAFVFPTLSDPWGFVVNEAMACGLPVIATDVAGCVADLVQHGETGLVVAAHDVAGLSSAMAKLATDAPRRARMGEHGAGRIQHFSPAAWAEGMAKAVTNI